MLQDILEPLVCERFRSDERYRTGHLRVINALPHRFLNEEWLSIVFSRIEKLELENITSEYTNLIKGKSPYYVRMGIAWLMATALAKFPDKTRTFATNCNLPDDVIKLYIRKARESFRTRSVKAIENTSL